MPSELSRFAAKYWKRMPFLRLIVPLLLGIIMQLSVPCLPIILSIVAGCSIGGLLFFQLMPVQQRFAAAIVPGIFLNILLGCCGSLLLYQADIRHHPAFFEHVITQGAPLLLRIEEPLQENAHSYKTKATVIAAKSCNKWVSTKGHLLLYFQKESTLSCLQYNDEIIVTKKPKLIVNSGHPGTFNFQQYFASQQIYHQLYLQRSEFYKLPQQNNEHWIQRLLLQTKNYCLSQLEKNIGKGPEYGMAAALLIGYRLDLDKNVIQSYTNTGIVHVIAISGMHLALLYTTLVWALRWLPTRQWAAMLKAIVLLIVLWAFALLTGAPASVLRAVVMFSCITIGHFVLKRFSNTYNTLAASAFLLLCYQPYFAIDAGFQLSYLAVLSILLFYEPIYQLWQIHNKCGNLLWKIVALSCAAQLLTTPVSLFYFHQFPNYFLLANLVAVPLSTIIIYGELILLLIAPFNVPAKWAGWVIKYLIQLMNNYVDWLGGLPYAVIKDIHCTTSQAVFLYLFIAGLAFYIMAKWRPGFWLAFAGAGCCMLCHIFWIVKCQFQSKMIIYNIPSYTAIDCIEGNQVQFTGDDSLWEHPVAQQLFTVRKEMRVHPTTSILQQCGPYIRFHGKWLVIINRSLPKLVPPKKFQTDYILLIHNPALTIKELNLFYDYHLLIFAASNASHNIIQWKNDCYVLNLRFFSVPDQGAYVINF